MSGVTISQLALVPSLTGTELIPIVQNGVTSSVDPTTLGSFINAGVVTDCPTDHAITTAENLGTFTNLGAAGSITLTLPTPAIGLQYTFVVVAAQTMIVDIAGSVVVALGEIASSAGGSVSSDSPYSILNLKAVSPTLWVATFMLGTWTPA